MKYDTLAEEVLDFLASDRSWAEAEAGDVESPMGWFALLDIPDPESAEMGLAHFLNVVPSGSTVEERKDALTAMVGAWIVGTDSQGAMSYQRFLSWSEAERTFWADAERYERWDQGCEGHESLAGEHMGESVYCDGSCVR